MVKRHVLAMGFLLAGAVSARAVDTEQRTYSIQVDGKPVGECRMTMTRRDDGAEEMSTQAAVRVKVLITFTYTYKGTEVWKNGQLVSLTSSCNDNGRHFTVNAVNAEDGLHVTVNRKERIIRPEVWTTSYWKLPDARFHNAAVTLLDADRGAELPRRLEYIAAEDISAAGQSLKCYHFRVQGGPSPIDLWFDAQHRLVRQDFVEQGYRTLIHLAAIDR